MPATIAIAASVPVLARPVLADTVSVVRDRSSLQSSDRLHWSSLEQILNPLAPNPDDFLPNSFSAISSNGLEISVEIPPAGGDITSPFFFQNNPGVQTNFAPGDFLLFTGFSPTVIPTGNSNPLTIIFDENVEGAGTQIAASGSENIDYEVFVSAIDDAENLLGTFSAPGISSGVRDDSAVFLGVRSDTANIKSLVFSTSSPQRGFGINTVSIAATKIPEPHTLIGSSTALVLGIIFKRKKPAR